MTDQRHHYHRLSEKLIDEILLKHSATIRSPIPDIQEKARKEWEERRRAELSLVSLQPGAEKFFVDKACEILARSVPSPGESIGMISSHALSEFFTQMMLKTFHTSGRGLQEDPNVHTERIVGLVKKPNFWVNIVFEDDLISVEDASALLMGMCRLSLKLSASFSIVGDLSDSWWMPIAREMFGKIGEDERIVSLRMKVPITELVKTRVSVPEIADRIRETFSGMVKKMPILSSADVLPSPTFEGTIDICFRLKELGDHLMKSSAEASFVDKKILIVMFLLNDVKGIISNIICGKIPRVVDVEVSSKTIAPLIKEERRGEKEGEWTLVIEETEHMLSGVSIDRFEKIFDDCGIKWRRSIIRWNYILEIPEGNSPSEFIMKTCKDRRLLNHTTAIAVVEGATSFDGSTFRAVLNWPGVSQKHTIASSPHEILAVLGIFAVRRWIERSFYLLTKGAGHPVVPSLFSALAALMTHYGVLSPLTSGGAQIQNRGVFSGALFGSARRSIVNGSACGEMRGIQSVTDAVVAGSRVPLGTGYSNISHTYVVKDSVNNRTSEFFIREVVRGEMPDPRAGTVMASYQSDGDDREEHALLPVNPEDIFSD